MKHQITSLFVITLIFCSIAGSLAEIKTPGKGKQAIKVPKKQFIPKIANETNQQAPRPDHTFEKLEKFIKVAEETKQQEVRQNYTLTKKEYVSKIADETDQQAARPKLTLKKKEYVSKIADETDQQAARPKLTLKKKLNKKLEIHRKKMNKKVKAAIKILHDDTAKYFPKIANETNHQSLPKIKIANETNHQSLPKIKIAHECVPPMIYENPKDPNSKCIIPGANGTGIAPTIVLPTIKPTTRPTFRPTTRPMPGANGTGIAPTIVLPTEQSVPKIKIAHGKKTNATRTFGRRKRAPNSKPNPKIKKH